MLLPVPGKVSRCLGPRWASALPGAEQVLAAPESKQGSLHLLLSWVSLRPCSRKWWQRQLVCSIGSGLQSGVHKSDAETAEGHLQTTFSFHRLGHTTTAATFT
ncbi:hypothetical protein MTO96_043959 [Rhipicephalus appendiculatus]